MKTAKVIFLAILAVAILCGGYVAWILFGSKTSNPHDYATVGDIAAPWGYERIDGDDAAYSAFLRRLPLKGRGSDVMLFTGGKSSHQSLSYAVIDLPLLSNAEQCADACMRLRAEYLYRTGQYGRISFHDVNGNTLAYGGGSSRKAFEQYLRHLYGVASTFSLSREMTTRPLADMQPGDVFVYPAPQGQMYGHAVLVVDVAVDSEGKKAFLLAEGNTPACDIHVMRNLANPYRSPWFMLDKSADNLMLSVFLFKSSDLKHF